MTSQRLFAVLLSFTLLITSSSAFAVESAFDRIVKSKTVRCGYFTWPPYITKDANTGKLSGINYDVMNTIGRNLGLKVAWTSEIGVGDVVTALESGKVDAVCASVWPNPARAQNLTLSVPTFYSIAYAFVRAGDMRFDGDFSKANNKNVKVSVIEGDITQDLAQEKLPDATFVALPQTASGSEILLQLVTKKADIVLVDEGLINDFMKTNPGTLRRVEGVPPARIFGEHLAVARGELLLKNMLDQSIGQLVNDGVIELLTKKYAAEYKSEFMAPIKTYTPIP